LPPVSTPWAPSERRPADPWASPRSVDEPASDEAVPPAAAFREETEIPRRPAAGGLIAGWNRPEVEPAPRPGPPVWPPVARSGDEAGRSGAPPWRPVERSGDEVARPGVPGWSPVERSDDETSAPVVSGWAQVLPPVDGAQDRPEERGAAGIDEATTFMSQWGPPPLAVPDEQRRSAPPERGWGSPAAPSRAGAGSTGANPHDPAPVAPPRATGLWTRSAPPPPIADSIPADATADPTPRPAAHRTAHHAEPSADRTSRSADPAADRTWRPVDPTADQSLPAVDLPARPAPEAPAAPGEPRPEQDGSTGVDRVGTDWTAGRPVRSEADQDVADRRGMQRGDGVEEPTEVIGPFDIGAWSLQDRDGVAAPDRRRQRGQDVRPERIEERAEERVPAGTRAGGGGGGGDEPPDEGGGGGRGGGGGDKTPHRHTIGDRIRTFIRGIGQTFLTLGMVLLLLAAYEVWFTNLVNHRTQHRLTTALEKQWDDGDDPTVAAGPAKPGEKIASLPLGDAFALIYMPDFGTDYVYSVVEGTGVNELNEGPGHYVGTPLPGAVGNVAIAGHRVGKGSPFLNLDKLKAGSAIVIRTKDYWYTYRVLGDTRTGDPEKLTSLGIPGREIVDPTNVGVIAPVPDKPGAQPTRRMLTLTTCHPKFSARQRMVVHAIQDGAPYPVSKGAPPAMSGK
jgi:sortase A